jgi:hypothetical protein
MAPARIPENVVKLVAPARSVPNVTEHIRPFMKCNPERVVSVNVLSEPEAELVGGIFVLEGAEKHVPDDECPSMVTVDVLGIASVMNTVVSRAVQYKFKWAKRTNQLSMNPELV